jgi:hypothetical protein
MKRYGGQGLRWFMYLTLVGLICLTALIGIARYSEREVMILVMSVYFTGIACTGVGALGLIVIGIKSLVNPSIRK